MFISYGIKYVLNIRRKGDTEGINIRLRVTLHGERPLDFSIGINTDLAEWDAERQRIVSSACEAVIKNRMLDEIYNKTEEIFVRYKLIEKRIPTRIELKHEGPQRLFPGVH